MRILVLTLHCGEKEFEACKASLHGQVYQNWSHMVWKDLGNHSAHRTLYTEIMRRNNEFDLFIKLDADMILRQHCALQDIVHFFGERPGLDHATFALDDWMSGSSVLWLHVFSNRVVWDNIADRLFVDPPPRIPGYRLRIRHAPAPIGIHCSDPEDLQAFHFGVHRALKALQPGRLWIQHQQSRHQWRLLRQVWERFDATLDRRIGLAMLGAELVWQGRLPKTANDYGDPALQAAFLSLGTPTAQVLHDLLKANWRPGPRRDLRWLRTVGLRFAVSAAVRRVRQNGDPPVGMPLAHDKVA